MGINTKLAVAVASIVFAAGAGSALAAPAQGGGPQQQSAGQAKGKPGKGNRGGCRRGALRGLVRTVAELTGLTVAQIKERLKAGDSLAEIVQSVGKTVDALKQAILADAQERLDAAVAAGTLTAAQATERLQQLQSNLDRIVSGVAP